VRGSQVDAAGLRGGLDIRLTPSSPAAQNVGLEQVTYRERAA
jgi:hypothetical protein